MTARARQRGIALMLVLWVLALLTVMAVGLTATQRTEMALTDNAVSDARFRAIADAAIAYMALDFSMPSVSLEAQAPAWLPNGVARPWQFAGTSLTIAVRNEASLINLNQAEEALLAALMVALEVPEDRAAALAAAIVDWRDEDDLTLLNGAEDGEYEAAGYAVGAKDGPFLAVEELLQVYGMDRDLYRRLAPELTVEGTDATLEESFASAATIAALQGVSLEQAQLQVEQRDSPTLPDGQAAAVVDRGGPLYRVQVQETSDGGAARQMEALVELAPGQQPPYRVLWRRLGASAGPPAPSAEDAEP